MLSSYCSLYFESKKYFSRIWAYEKVVSPKLEEVTSHDTADILLSQFEESESSPESHSVYYWNEGFGIASSPQGAHEFKLKNSPQIFNCHVEIVKMGEQHAKVFSGEDSLSKNSGMEIEKHFGLPI